MILKMILKSFDFQCDFDFKIINIWWFCPYLAIVVLYENVLINTYIMKSFKIYEICINMKYAFY